MEGCCRYCGQYYAVSVDGDISAEELDEKATRQCDCYEATVYQKRCRQKEMAVVKLGELFKGEQNSITDMLTQAIDMIVDLKLDQVSLKADGTTAYKVSMTKKGTVKVEKTVSTKRMYEE